MKDEPLLSIDVDAELRKLSTAALGPSQLPADLVRSAVAAGASRVELVLERRGLEVRDDGLPIPVDELRALASLLDPEAAPADRHRALVALESRPGRLALAAADADLRLETGTPGRRHVLSKERGRRPALRSLFEGGSGTVVRLKGLTADEAAARRSVLSACRFAPIPVLEGGREIPRGFEGVLAEAPLLSPLPGRISLPRAGDGGSVLLLHDGVIASRLSVPDAPAFEAVVEMRPLVASRSGGALREAMAPHVPALLTQAVALALALGARLPELETDDGARVRAQLLVAARKRWRRSDVLRLPLFRAVTGPEGLDGRWLRLLDLGRDREVACLEPHQDPGGFLLPAGPVLIIDGEERGRLAQLLGLRFRTPEPRRMDAPLGVRGRRALATLAAEVVRLARRVRHPRLGAELPDRALGLGERALLKALRAGDPESRLVMTDGAGPVRRIGVLCWALPRRNPAVAACARAVILDPHWAYPALYALLEDQARPAPLARALWRKGMDQSE
jgi:hypothetical protein